MNELVQVDFSAPPPEQTSATNETSVKDNLGQILNGRFGQWADARKEVEDNWIKDLRAFNGQYEPEIEQRLGNRSKVFVRLTRTKTLGSYARIIDLMLGRDRHWDIGTTPIPEIDAERKFELMSRIKMLDPTYVVQDEDLVAVEEIFANEACDGMRKEIEDQLSEENYEELFKASAMECCLLGTGAIKGPFVKVKKSSKWKKVNGSWELVVEEKVVPGLTAPSIFDLYPDPFCTRVEDGVGLFERHVMTAAHLRGLGDNPGFDSEAIEEIIRNSPNGNHQDFQHEIDRRRLAGVNDAFANNSRFDVKEYWGQITGSELSSAGVPVNAERLTEELQGNVWFSGARTIKVQLNPLKPERIPYQIFQYEKMPHQFWGTGVPRQMTDSQDIVNSGVRTILDNQAYSSGPQVEVNQDMLAPGEDPLDFYPWRVWLREGGDASQPMLRFYQPTNISANLMGIIDMARKFMDEETSLPSYTHGEQLPGLNKTAAGMSMLMGAANVALKSVIKNWDGAMIKPTIKGMYDWNMQWNTNDKIKGDMQVEARGSTALLAKEIQSQRLIQYATLTANPVDAALIGPKKRGNLLRQIAIASDLNPDEVAPDDDQFDAAPRQPSGPAGGGGIPAPDQPPAMGGGAPVPDASIGAQG